MMILRRFMQHIKEQNWFAVGLDVLVVIVGIFLGMQVTEWNEEHRERQAEAGYISRLTNELNVLRNDTKTRIAYAEWIKAHMVHTISVLRLEDAELDSEFIVNAYISAHGTGADIRIDTIDEILSTGAFSKIKDGHIRQEILRFNRVSQEARRVLSNRSDYQSEYRRVMPYETITLLRRNCSGAPSLNSLGVSVFQVPETCPPNLSSEQIKEAVSNLKHADLLPSLREALSNIDVKIRTLNNLYEVAGDSIGKLNR